MNNATGKRIGRVDLGRLARLTRKELRETLRDRRTVITLVLMPLLVYPLISISFNKSVLMTAQQASKIVYSIGVSSAQDVEVLGDLLSRGNQLLKTRQPGDPQPPVAIGAGTDYLLSDAESLEIGVFPASSLESQVADNTVHLAVRVQQSTAPDGERQRWVECELMYRAGSSASQRAMHIVEDRLRAVNDASLSMRLTRAGLPAGVPAAVTLKAIAAGRAAPFSLATLVPLVLILMTITGAVYPAIDLTAGERERGTLETLIAAPISRMALLIAKYVAVVTVAVLTALVNLVAMTVTIISSSLHEQLFPQGLSLTLMVEIFGLVVLFAAFFSAVMLAVTSFARSFKEAQAYLIPVMLLAISPGLLSLMPGLQLNGLLAVTPLVNMVLLSRDLLEHATSPGMAALAIVSTAIYAMAAIAIASKVFGNDALLYASRGSWSDLFHRPVGERTGPTATATLACLATMFPCFFLLGNLAARYAGNVSTRLLVHAGVSVVVFACIPLLFAAAQRVRIAAGFQLRRAAPLAFLGAAVLGGTLWPFAYELFMFGKMTGLVSLERGQLREIETLLTGLSRVVTGGRAADALGGPTGLRRVLLPRLSISRSARSVLRTGCGAHLEPVVRIVSRAQSDVADPRAVLAHDVAGSVPGLGLLPHRERPAGHGAAHVAQRSPAGGRAKPGFHHGPRLGPGGTRTSAVELARGRDGGRGPGHSSGLAGNATTANV